MTILLRQVKIADTKSPFNGLVKDILLQDHQIISISDKYKGEADQTIELKNAFVSPGFVDPFVHFCDPGMEHRETLDSTLYKSSQELLHKRAIEERVRANLVRWNNAMMLQEY